MPAVKYATPTCPTDCTTADLPAIAMADCVDAMITEESEIQEIFMTINDGAGAPKAKPTSWTSKSDWLAVIADTGNDKVRKLNVIGDKPLADATTRTLSKRRKKAGTKTQTINFDIDDISPANYDFMRQLQCGATVVIWYSTVGGYLYGGPNGFEVSVANIGEVLDRGENNYAVIRGILSWENQFSPPRIANPMAA